MVTFCRKETGWDCQKSTTDPVTLKVLSWNVGGLSKHSTDILLSQISMLTDWDVLLQECFKKMDGGNVGAHELFTPSELVGGLRCPAVIIHQRSNGQARAVGERADGLQSSWVDS